MVYLDHWAWRKISDSGILTKRFLGALKARNGTLAMSWLNLVEFNVVTYDHQTRKADALLDGCLPQVFFVNLNFFKVIEEEDKLLNGGEPTAPHADLVTLKFFVNHNLQKQNSLELFPKQNLLSLAREAQISTKAESFADAIIGRIESLRARYVNNREFALAVKRVPKGTPIQRGTRFIASELIGGVLKNSSLTFNQNHAIDICHAVVPVAYCDFVLLDRHWTTQVEQARNRFIEGGMSFPIAKVFSERENGVDHFLSELESGAKRCNP